MRLSAFADSFETSGELTVEVVTMFWASPQDAWLERGREAMLAHRAHVCTHTDGRCVSRCASHSKGQKQECVPVTAGFPWFSPTVFTQRGSASHCLTLSWTPQVDNCWL